MHGCSENGKSEDMLVWSSAFHWACTHSSILGMSLPPPLPPLALGRTLLSARQGPMLLRAQVVAQQLLGPSYTSLQCNTAAQ